MQIRNFVILKSIGMRCLKAEKVPSKADPDEYEAFKNMEFLLEEANSGKTGVFFLDASHFIFLPYPGFFWCLARSFFKVPSGRKGFNVLRALKAVTHRLIILTNERYINTQRSWLLFSL